MAGDTQMDSGSLKNVMGAITKLLKPSTPEPKGEINDSLDSEYYPMNEKIGYCCIFNQKTFNDEKLDNRSGTDVDADQLDQLFKKMGFDVDRFDDYKDGEILLKLQKVSKKDFKNYSCFVCCILSYGTEDGKICAKEGTNPIQRIYERFYADKCHSLAEKPKIFFIQACPCSVQKSVRESTDYGRKVTFKIPTTSDFLVVYSTVPGVYSWENSNNGSWFIDALCSTITKYIGNMDLLRLLSIVNHKVAIKCENYESTKLKVEVPCITSTLTRDIKFPVAPVLEPKLVEEDAFSAPENKSLNISKSGKFYIFNHISYKDDPMNKYPRRGTENDVKNLQKMFEKLNFEGDVFTDKSIDFILNKLKSVANGSHEKYSCFVCCILTHGDYGALKANDGFYNIDDVLSLFYDNWYGKPKMFFIQACQGKEADPGHKIVKSQKQSTDSDRTYNYNFRHLTHRDFLIVSSAAPGYFSFRDEDGSWFIQELFKSFNNPVSDKDFLQLLTITNRQVAKRASNVPDNTKMHDKKQTLCLTSTLTQNIDFGYPIKITEL